MRNSSRISLGRKSIRGDGYRVKVLATHRRMWGQGEQHIDMSNIERHNLMLCNSSRSYRRLTIVFSTKPYVLSCSVALFTLHGDMCARRRRSRGPRVGKASDAGDGALALVGDASSVEEIAGLIKARK